MEPEQPLAITARYKVINPDAQDFGRVGVFEDMTQEPFRRSELMEYRDV